MGHTEATGYSLLGNASLNDVMNRARLLKENPDPFGLGKAAARSDINFLADSVSLEPPILNELNVGDRARIAIRLIIDKNLKPTT